MEANLIEFVDENPNIEFILTKKDEEYIIKPNIEIFKIRIIVGKQYKYILKRDRLYRCTEEFENANLKLLEIFRSQYINQVELGEEQLKDLQKENHASRQKDIDYYNETNDSSSYFDGKYW